MPHRDLTTSKERNKGFESKAGAPTIYLPLGTQRTMANASQSRSLPDKALYTAM